MPGVITRVRVRKAFVSLFEVGNRDLHVVMFGDEVYYIRYVSIY